MARTTKSRNTQTVSLDQRFDASEFVPKKPVDLHVEYDNESAFATILKLHHGASRAEHKYDGFGVKISTVSGVQLYSLNGTSWDSACFPEFHRDLAALPGMVAVGEIVGRPNRDGFTHTDEFAAVQLRPKTGSVDASSDLVTDSPLELRIYDLLELGGKPVAGLPLGERQSLITSTLRTARNILPVDGRVTSDPAELQSWLVSAFDDGLEGFVVKDLTTPYVPGTRTKDWLKLKRSTTFDLIVLGLYQTPERLADGWACSNVLGGVINERTGRIETFGKITMPSKAIAQEIADRLQGNTEYSWSSARKYYWENQKGPVNHAASVDYNPIMTSRGGQMMRKTPYLYVKRPENSIVVEASCLNVSSGVETWHSCGLYEGGSVYTMRQPKFIQIREDKTPKQATTTQQVLTFVSNIDDDMSSAM